MNKIPKKTSERLASGLKHFQKIVATAKNQDVNESDTATILIDIFHEVFGYDKYFQITSEFAIHGTYCDLALKIDGKIQLLIEAKAAGVDLKDPHVKQAIDYAANQGVEWVVLTNCSLWRVYRVIFEKPIGYELVCEFDLLDLNPRNSDDLHNLYVLSKEGWGKSALHDFYQQRQAISPFYLSAAILSNRVVAAIRRELRRVSPNVKIEPEHISEVLKTEVLKRGVLEGEKYENAIEAVAMSSSKTLSSVKTKEPELQNEAPPASNYLG